MYVHTVYEDYMFSYTEYMYTHTHIKKAVGQGLILIGYCAD